MTLSSKKNPLISYLSGKASPLQIQQVESWINLNESNRKLFEKMSEAWELQDETALMNLLPEDAPWKRKTEEKEEYVPHDFVANPFPSGYMFFAIRVAATLMILVGIYFLFESKFDSVWQKANPEMISAQSPVGQDLKIDLPQTGKVNLKSASELMYPAHFGGFAQEIVLKGGAEFEILAKEGKHPVQIRVENSTVEVENGKFSVSQNGDPSIIEILVEEGSITFKSNDHSTPLYIESGHRVIFANEDNSIYTEKLYSDVSLLE